MNKMTIATLALLIGALTACGGTTPPAGEANTAPAATTPIAAGSAKETAAKTFGDSTVTQTKSLSAASSNPSVATSAAFSLGLSGATLVNTVKGAMAAWKPMALPSVFAQAGDCGSAGGYTQAGDTITYDCTYTYSSIVIKLSGQVVANSSSVAFKNLRIDYDFNYSGYNGKYAIVYNGGFTYTSTTLNGRFDVDIAYDVTSSQGNTKASAKTSTYYDNIDFGGCSAGAKSGSITATSVGDGTTYKSGTVKIVYGPTCGAANVFSN